MEKRNPLITLNISLRHAKEYLDMLCEMRKDHKIEEIQESNKLLIQQRALWISLIIEIGRLFDTYETKNRKVISLKKIDFLEAKKKIDNIHGEKIIGRIIKTRKIFTAHWGEEKYDPVSITELCDSNLRILLDSLNKPLNEFENWLKNSDPKVDHAKIII